MRQPPSPLLLSARKRRPRRNPPSGAFSSVAAPADGAPAGDADDCALLQREPDVHHPGHLPSAADDEPASC